LKHEADLLVWMLMPLGDSTGIQFCNCKGHLLAFANARENTLPDRQRFDLS
jgi:hypothetical protein